MLRILKLLGLGALFIGSIYTRSTDLIKFRPWDSIIVGSVAFVWFLIELHFFFQKQRKKDDFSRAYSLHILAILILIIGLVLGKEIHFLSVKSRVLNAPATIRQELGQHFIVGYRDFDELTLLVDRGLVGGIFITDRNVENKSIEEIRKEIDTLQMLQQKHDRPPLLVMADQEGGVVSKLSPPLPQFEPLGYVLDHYESLENAGRAYGQKQGRELQKLGVNVNLAPVVDINENLINSNDKQTKIYQRAISDDPEIIAKVALYYCRGLAEYHVFCTLKHFPGLGRVSADTHVGKAILDLPLSALREHEFKPFRSVLKETDAFLMIGHVMLPQIDPWNPASASQRIIGSVIRQGWEYENIIITDDFSMRAINSSPQAAADAAVRSLNAGSDLILFSYDHDLFYYAFDALMEAQKNGLLYSASLKQSKERLGKIKFP